MRKKITRYLFFILILFAIGGGIAVVSLTQVTRDLNFLITLHRVESFRKDLIINLQTVQGHLYTIGTTFGTELDVIVENVSSLNRAVNRCSGCHHPLPLRRKLDGVARLVEKYEDALSAFITTTANPKRVKRLQTAAVEIGSVLLEETNEMTMIANQSLQDRTVRALEKVESIKDILLLSLFFTMLIGTIVAVSLTGELLKPIRALSEAAKKVASGRLGYRTDYTDSTEFGQLAKTFNDMSTSLKETQEQLVQAAKLAAVGELAANIAHEINNPLTTILGYAELLRDERDAARIRRDLHIIEAESLRARDIVTQLLEFSKKRKLVLTSVDINETLSEVLQFISPQMKHPELKVIDELNALPPILADKNQLKQVFLNLVNNAIQAMPRGGTLGVRTAHADGSVVVEVSDTGTGIPDDIVHRMFEPFFTTKKDKGTGLGLPISYRIITEHAGRIEVRTGAEKGTTFKVILPIRTTS